MRLNLQRASAQEDSAGPPSLAPTKQFLQDNPLVQLVTNTREMIPLHSNGRTCGTEDGMPTLRLQMNPQYDYGCKQNADGNSLFVTRHAPCDRDTTSESELPPAVRDEELSRTHPVSFGEIETTTCNATPVHHRANYAHWKATFRSSLENLAEFRRHRLRPMLNLGETPRDASPTLLRLRFLYGRMRLHVLANTSSRRPGPADAIHIGTQYPNVVQTHRQTPWRHQLIVGDNVCPIWRGETTTCNARKSRNRACPAERPPSEALWELDRAPAPKARAEAEQVG